MVKKLNTDPSKLFRNIGEKSRLQVIRLCFDAERSAEELIEQTGLEKSLLSKHLKVLLDAGILMFRCEGRQKIYSLNEKVRHPHRPHALNLPCCNIELK